MENKICKKCEKQYEVTDDDLDFYKQMSPTFDGKVFKIPAPTLCPDCRRQRRFAWRNITKIYKRKCDLTEKEIISGYAPNSKYKVYETSEWWSDKWDPMEYGQEYDPSRSFFEQLKDLDLKVPKMHAVVVDNENSPFTNNVTRAVNSYLIQNATNNENCMFGQGLWNNKDCVDCLRIYDCEGCYESSICEKCYQCHHSINSINSRESYFLDGCTGSANCFACTNLSNKQYWVYNKQSTKEEFEKTRDEFLALSGEAKDQKFAEIRKFLSEQPKKFAHILDSEDSTGDHLYHSKNLQKTFYANGDENLSYCSNVDKVRNSMDYDFWGNETENILDCLEVGINSQNIAFSRSVYTNCSNIYYSIGVYNSCRNCFGSVGLKQKEYCILNKQFTRDEYEKKVAEIIEKMIADGEWGQYFPMSMSQYGYNETIAPEYYPLTKEQAQAEGINWQDEDFGLKYDGPFYEPKEISEYDPQRNENAKTEQDALLAGILKCEVSGKPYKIQPQELLFYIKNNLQIPRRHPDQRYEDRVAFRNPMSLWHRDCSCQGEYQQHQGKCPNEFETSYAPDRPEKVFCESCYQDIIK
ncbi:MAG: hypothetical protein ABH810_03505 [bacterium]